MQTLWSCLDRDFVPFAESGIVLAISGGPDSRALLEAVASWPKRNYGRFVVAIVNHGQREEALAESNFVIRRAKRLAFHCEAIHLPIFGNACHEQDLRNARYQALSRVASRHGCVALSTAHHMDDNAEGYLMALMGLGGGELGAAMNDIERIDDLTLIRPFLGLSKRDLLLSLSLDGKTDFVVDRLDEERRGSRAYVRHEILSKISAKAPAVSKRLASFGQIQRNNQTMIEKRGQELIDWESDHARLHCPRDIEREIVTAALWQILKKFSSGKDLRACQPTVSKLIQDLENATSPNPLRPGLDQISNRINLKSLDAKEYQFPGVLVIRKGGSIIARPV